MLKLLAIFLLSISAAHAGSQVVEFTLPTKTTTGDPVPATGPEALVSVRVERGNCPGIPFVKIDSITVPAAQLKATFTGIAPQLWCYRGFAINTANQESTATTVGNAIAMPTAPAAPEGLKVQDFTIFQAVGTSSGLAMLPVGTVPALTACNGANFIVAGGKTYYNIARSTAIVWFGSVQPQAVFSLCSSS